jgi:hypothetical protein
LRRCSTAPGSGQPVEVALIATVHVGDAEYYQELQEECEVEPSLFN